MISNAILLPMLVPKRQFFFQRATLRTSAPLGHCVVRAILFVVDKQVHYSILEGVKLAGAGWESFNHSEVDHLGTILSEIREKKTRAGLLVVVEGVYGIDGDVAPLPEILDIASRFDARVLLDDAHATGVIGPGGRGTTALCASKHPDLIMGSLSKSLGSLGGWIACTQEVADYLRYYAKSIVFSVGLPAPAVAAGSKSLEIINEDPSRMTSTARKR